MKPRIYNPAPLAGTELHPLFAFRHSKEKPWLGVFGGNLPKNFFEHEVEYVERIEDADAIVLPNNFKTLTEERRAHIASYADQAEKAGKPIFIFAYGDMNDRVEFDPRVFVFRLTAYKSTIGSHDILVPTTAEDFGLVLRTKGDKPVISFCGFAGFKTLRQWAGYFYKTLLWQARALLKPILKARLQGIYWRRKAMHILRRSKLVEARFIIRRSFSGAFSTIELDSAKAREEFLSNMRDSDFVLAPKGDGNYSNRFLEALAFGRIPVVIDTDIVLPFEDSIDYSKIMVRVPMNGVHRIDQYVRDFYDAHDAKQWEEAQRLANETFTKYLRQDSFFRVFFERALGKGD